MDNGYIEYDLYNLLSRYRLMAYHNIETRRDEGIVFVERGKETTNGNLIKWNSEKDLTRSFLSKIEYSLDTPIATSSQIYQQEVSICSQSNSNINNNYALYESIFDIQEDPQNADPKRKLTVIADDIEYDQKASDLQPTETENYVRKNFAFKKTNNLKKSDVERIFHNKSEICTVLNKFSINMCEETEVAAVKKEDYCSDFKSGQQNKMESAETDKALMNGTLNIEASDFNFKQLPIGNIPHNLSVKTNSVQEKEFGSTMTSNCAPINIPQFMRAAKCGWVREVFKKNSKLVSNKLKIAYIPPQNLRHLGQRILDQKQLVSFLLENCPDSILILSNFSFSPVVLGLGEPWEIIKTDLSDS